MEHLQNQHLNEPRSYWTPWQADEELLAGIMNGELVPLFPPDDEPTVLALFQPPLLQVA